MTPGRGLAVLALFAGCATSPSPPVRVVAPAPVPAPAPSPSAVLLARADWTMGQGDYAQARQAYDDFARQYPNDAATPRVLATRNVLETLTAARDEVTRLNAEVLRAKEQGQDIERDLDKLRRDLASRVVELTRMRQELGERQAEVARLLAEADGLRADLEKLKSVDRRLERPR